MTKRPETQSVESPKRPETLLKDLLMSDSFDDLVAARLEMTLNWTMEDFNLIDLKTHDLDEVVGNLQYCRALVTVLEWFTVGDYDDITKKLNRIEDELKEEYY